MKAINTTTRRRFFWKAGAAALTAPLGVAAAQGSPTDTEDAASLKARLTRLEDLDAIRELNRSFARLVNARSHAALTSLFMHPAEAPAPHRIRGVASEAFDASDVIQVERDGRTASARIACGVRIGTPMEGTCSVLDMALQQGGGIAEHAENGVFEAAYTKHQGVWKIAALSYRGSKPENRQA